MASRVFQGGHDEIVGVGGRRHNVLIGYCVFLPPMGRKMLQSSFMLVGTGNTPCPCPASSQGTKSPIESKDPSPSGIPTTDSSITSLNKEKHNSPPESPRDQ